MNLFILDENIKTSVSYYSKPHVNKILLEVCQCMMSGLRIRVRDNKCEAWDADLAENINNTFGKHYAIAYEKHPLVQYLVSFPTHEEFMRRLNFLLRYANALATRFTKEHKNSKIHACEKVISFVLGYLLKVQNRYSKTAMDYVEFNRNPDGFFLCTSESFRNAIQNIADTELAKTFELDLASAVMYYRLYYFHEKSHIKNPSIKWLELLKSYYVPSLTAIPRITVKTNTYYFSQRTKEIYLPNILLYQI